MTAPHTLLTPAQHAAWLRDGFLTLPRFVDPAACEPLRERAATWVREFDADTYRSIFTTRDQTRTSDAYFLESGDKIRCFLEEDALDAQGRLQVPKGHAINKIGHALHDLDPVFERFSRTPALAALAQDLGFNEPRLIQSMLIFKQPHIGGEVGLHQDATFLYTEPPTVTGFWFALEDATLENGCLWALPGGHRLGLKRRFVRTPEGEARFVPLDRTPFPDQQLVPLEAPAGTLVVLHGLCPHQSGPNRSSRSRQAYAIHAIEASAHYPADNWLMRSPRLALRGFCGF